MLMEVPISVMNEWKNRKKRGDISAIHQATGMSRVTINKALNGRASAEVILKISEYYSSKEIITPQEIEAAALRMMKKK